MTNYMTYEDAQLLGATSIPLPKPDPIHDDNYRAAHLAMELLFDGWTEEDAVRHAASRFRHAAEKHVQDIIA